MHNKQPYSFEKTEERGKKSLKKILHITTVLPKQNNIKKYENI